MQKLLGCFVFFFLPGLFVMPNYIFWHFTKVYYLCKRQFLHHSRNRILWHFEHRGHCWLLFFSKWKNQKTTNLIFLDVTDRFFQQNNRLATWNVQLAFHQLDSFCSLSHHVQCAILLPARIWVMINRCYWSAHSNVQPTFFRVHNYFLT